MISAIILSPSLDAPAPRASEALARSLSALVRAAVEGVLRDVTIVGTVGDQLPQIADAAGCAFIETAAARDGLAKALAQVRSDMVFVLAGGYALPGGFAQEASDLLLEAGLFRGALLRPAPTTFLTRLFPSLARPVGALAPRSLLQTAAPRDLGDLIRALKTRRGMAIRAVKAV